MAIRNARSSAKKKIVRFNIAPQYYYFDRRDEPKSLLSSQSVYRQKIKYEAELKKAYSTTCSKTSNAEADLPGSSQILQEKRNVISRCTSLICQDVYDSVVARQRLLGNNMLGDRGRIRFKVYFLHPSFENACEKCAKWQLLRFGIRCYIDKPDNITEQMTQTVDLHYQDFFICYSCNRYTL
ncbi:hypothetical protein H4219_005062 [Mycoemilia scoparia]|uniref:Uncharacterized protein n=1 Tax=Mycoemilia scoparia TaxID=417184 RepID=A0A9W8DQ93_9FUNG|nr:hypothetical protein H4219_005062 [Mycoemilia scoparia]